MGYLSCKYFDPQKGVAITHLFLQCIVETVLTCSRQRITLQGHRQDKIDFSSPPTSNEGNFFTILRLLAKNDAVLREHIVSGARNAKYTRKTIQNGIIKVATDYIRSIYHDCRNKCPHFSTIWVMKSVLTVRRYDLFA